MSISQNPSPNLLCGDSCDDPTDPTDPTPIGPPPPSPPAPGYYNVTFSCTNALLYRPVGLTGPAIHVANHAYIYQTIFDHVDEWGVAPYNQYQFIIIEGLPQYFNPLPPPTNWGWLENHYDENLDDSSPSPVIPSANDDHPLTDPRAGAIFTEGGSAGCPKTAAIGDVFDATFDVDSIPYNPVPLLGAPGENSNWFAWWNINAVGMPNMGIPPNAPGFPGTAYTFPYVPPYPPVY